MFDVVPLKRTYAVSDGYMNGTMGDLGGAGVKLRDESEKWKADLESVVNVG